MQESTLASEPLHGSVRAKGGMSLRNDIIMRDVIYAE